jgi:hypothetical protein
MEKATDSADTTFPPPVLAFAERFALGVFVGAGTVSVVHLESWWAARLAFTAFVLFLLFRWERLVRDPLAP